MTQLQDFIIADEPYYRPVGDEVSIFEAAYRHRLPVNMNRLMGGTVSPSLATARDSAALRCPASRRAAPATG